MFHFYILPFKPGTLVIWMPTVPPRRLTFRSSPCAPRLYWEFQWSFNSHPAIYSNVCYNSIHALGVKLVNKAHDMCTVCDCADVLDSLLGLLSTSLVPDPLKGRHFFPMHLSDGIYAVETLTVRLSVLLKSNVPSSFVQIIRSS